MIKKLKKKLNYMTETDGMGISELIHEKIHKNM